MGEVYDRPRSELTADEVEREPPLPDHGRRRRHPLDPRLRLRAGARLAAEHARLDDQQEALLGPGPADLRLPGVRHVRRRSAAATSSTSGRSRAGRRSRATPRIGRTSTRSRSPARAAGRRSAGSPTSATRGSTRGSCPFSTLHYREDPRLLGAVVPGRLHHRELPRPVPQLVLLDAGDVDGPAPRAALPDDLRLRAAASARTAGRCTRAGATRSSSTRRPSGWASTSCAGCSCRARPEDNILFGWHAADEARRRAARPVERLCVPRDLRPAGGLVASATPRRRRSPIASALDRWILSRVADLAARVEDRLRGLRRRGGDAGDRPRRSTTCRPGTCADRAGASRGPMTAPTGTAAFATLPRVARRPGPDPGPDPALPGRGDLRQPRRRRAIRTPRTAST